MQFKNIGKYSLATVVVCLWILVLLYTRQISSPLPVIEYSPYVPPPNSLTTHAWGIFNPTTGELIAGHDTNVVLPIASITKLFTAEAVERSEKRDIAFTIRATDLEAEGRAGKLFVGQKVTPYELVYPLLIESSNDAAEAIVRSLGTEFKDSVDTTTKSLALNNTTIVEPTGLSDDNTSTVEDLARFFVHMRQENHHLLDITQLRTYISSYSGYLNNSPARSLASFTGGKHGFTDEAHKTFVGTFSIGQSQTEIGIVVLKSDDLVADIQELLRYGEALERY